MTDIPPYPLAWPENAPRTTKPVRGQFTTSLSKAIANVEDSLRRFASDSNLKVTDVQVTSMKAGLTSAQPEDRGVSVWFRWDGEMRCIPVDRYDLIEHNVQAIHHILEARRTELRHGGLNVVRQAFRGFTALPAPDAQREWRELLGFSASEQINEQSVAENYRRAALDAHPDRGGSADQMAKVNDARDAAMRAIRNQSNGR